ncbi:unnamed protein product [Oncorhynchus mykiss]|uniref:DIX domain-containing protein n=1 Tax=Oncorhynchus mykiss TaxID=8022 RepID=A0A060XLQ8_ONCMY|nr:unnamed protein product [Oncorhynchus mykiss]
MAETKIIYHIDEEETPYLVKIPIPAENITLLDFKQVLNKPNYKFFFKSMDQDFGVVKEEISDESAKLPCFNGRVVSWLVSSDTPAAAELVSPVLPPPPAEVRPLPSPPPPPLPPPPVERTGGIGDSRPPSFQYLHTDTLFRNHMNHSILVSLCCISSTVSSVFYSSHHVTYY